MRPLEELLGEKAKEMVCETSDVLALLLKLPGALEAVLADMDARHPAEAQELRSAVAYSNLTGPGGVFHKEES